MGYRIYCIVVFGAFPGIDSSFNPTIHFFFVVGGNGMMLTHTHLYTCINMKKLTGTADPVYMVISPYILSLSLTADTVTVCSGMAFPSEVVQFLVFSIADVGTPVRNV